MLAKGMMPAKGVKLQRHYIAKGAKAWCHERTVCIAYRELCLTIACLARQQDDRHWILWGNSVVVMSVESHDKSWESIRWCKCGTTKQTRWTKTTGFIAYREPLLAAACLARQQDGSTWWRINERSKWQRWRKLKLSKWNSLIMQNSEKQKDHMNPSSYPRNIVASKLDWKANQLKRRPCRLDSLWP